MESIMPRQIGAAINYVKKDPDLSIGINTMMDRSDAFESELAMMLVGIAVVPEARRYINETLDTMWKSRRFPVAKNNGYDEVVIGAGLHAAIYCAVRVAEGHPKPLVLESTERVGGALGQTNGATFFLNSRNRPGNLTAPGEGGALNVLPGAMIQPSDLSSDEYQRNSDIGFVIRSTLAMNAHVMTDSKVVNIRRAQGKRRKYAAVMIDGRSVYADRVIVATGLGRSVEAVTERKNVMDFMTFMSHMDRAFPLQGIKRVGVVGWGDGGKTAIEALVGQGPNDHWSMPSMDYVERIDWWDTNLKTAGRTRTEWESCVRSRYKGIGRMLPAAIGGPSRIKPIGKNASYIEGGYKTATIDDVPYDLVIDCRGYQSSVIQMPTSDAAPFLVGGRPVSTKTGYSSDEIYTVGPAARIPQRSTDGEKIEIPENGAALFRYADRTASLAASLS